MPVSGSGFCLWSVPVNRRSSESSVSPLEPEYDDDDDDDNGGGGGGVSQRCCISSFSSNHIGQCLDGEIRLVVEELDWWFVVKRQEHCVQSDFNAHV